MYCGSESEVDEVEAEIEDDDDDDDDDVIGGASSLHGEGAAISIVECKGGLHRALFSPRHVFLNFSISHFPFPIPGVPEHAMQRDMRQVVNDADAGKDRPSSRPEGPEIQ